MIELYDETEFLRVGSSSDEVKSLHELSNSCLCVRCHFDGCKSRFELLS